MSEGKLFLLVSDSLLQDFVDGRLDPEMAARVEGLICFDSDLRAKAQDYAALNGQIKNFHAYPENSKIPVGVEKLASELNDELRKNKALRSEDKPAVYQAFRKMAAACVVVVLGALGGYFYGPGIQDAGRETAQVTSLPTSEGIEHTIGTRTVVSMSQEGQVQETLPNIVSALLFSLKSLNFQLIETRISNNADSEMVQVEFQTDTGERVILKHLNQQDGQNEPIVARQEGNESMLSWQVNGRSFTMLGEMDKKTLLEVGHKLIEQLSGNQLPELGESYQRQDANSDFDTKVQTENSAPTEPKPIAGDGSI